MIRGHVTGCVRLSAKTGNYGIEIPERTWHTVVCLQSGSVVYEVKDGPYAPINDKNFASWGTQRRQHRMRSLPG